MIGWVARERGDNSGSVVGVILVDLCCGVRQIRLDCVFGCTGHMIDWSVVCSMCNGEG